MNVGSAARARRGIQRRGHKVSFRRGLPATSTAEVFAVVEGYGPGELVNGITSGTRHIIVSRLDLEGAGFPVPPRKGDRIYLGAAFDLPTTIESVDPDHREYMACYDIVTKGA
jgi:hypothetical protein